MTGAGVVERLVTEERRRWVSLAGHHCAVGIDPEEAIGRAVVIALEHLPEEATTDPAYAAAWFTTVLKRECWALNRKARRRAAPSLDEVPEGAGEPLANLFPDYSPTPDERVEEILGFQQRVEAIEALKPDERTALILLGLGLSYGEIQRLRGWTHTKVNRCLAEGRATARSLLARAA